MKKLCIDAKMSDDGQVEISIHSHGDITAEDIIDIKAYINYALDDLIERKTDDDDTKYYNGKIVCVNKGHERTSFTQGKIYEVKNGIIYADDDVELENLIFDRPWKSFDEINETLDPDFVELVD